MRYVITCGGSGGHINPGLAVARLLRGEGHEVLFIGAPQGLERDLVPREGFDIEFVEARSLTHSVKPKALLRNAAVAAGMARSLGQAKKILKRFRPNAVLGTGGYASFPALSAASRMKIPVLVHESNAFPGVTTKITANRADAVLVGVEACRDAYKHKDRVHVVGTPVRPEFFTAERAAAREAMRLDNRPAIVSVFGSQGARDMNRLMLDFMALQTGGWQHIHAAGPKRYEAFMAAAAERGLVFDGITGLRAVDYIYNAAEAYASADLVISRAGAATLADLEAVGTPAVLIPSPNVAADHQTANAKLLADAGGAVLLPEKGLTAERLYGVVKELLSDRDRLDDMKRKLKALAVPGSARKIADMMIRMSK